MGKLNSRKFWLAIGGSAAGVASIVGGIVVPDERATLGLTITGAILTAVSVVAYEFAEAYTDGASLKSNTVNVTASTTSAATVEKLITKDETSLTTK